MAASRFPPAWLRARIEQDYPNLKKSKWKPKSPRTNRYQCIAWAACDTRRRWWPVGDPPVTYWPPNVPAEETVDCFIQAFATIGFKPCESDDYELGFQKVALFVDNDGIPSHMVRQHLLGIGWLSKLGDWEDIYHPRLSNLEGRTHPEPTQGYGTVQQILKRSWLSAMRNGALRGWWASLGFWLFRISHR